MLMVEHPSATLGCAFVSCFTAIQVDGQSTIFVGAALES